MTPRPWPPPPDWDGPLPDYWPTCHYVDRYRHLPRELDDVEVALRERTAGGAR